MLTIKTILCPVDFTDRSREAAGLAVGLAKKLGAEIQFLHVFNSIPPYIGWPGGIGLADATAKYVESARTAVKESLGRFEAEFSDSGVAIKTEMLNGVPWNEIVERSSKVDLIVMATRGTEPPSHLLVGSVAERVVRFAECPVLTVPVLTDAANAAPFERIVVGVDFSEPSDAAIAFAIDFAEALGARVTLLHVVPMLAYAAAQLDVADSPNFEAEVLNQASEKLEKLAEGVRRPAVTVESLIVQGYPATTIGDTAQQRGMQVIVVGSHGRTGLKRAVLGSVAEKTVRHAPVPVLTFR